MLRRTPLLIAGVLLAVLLVVLVIGTTAFLLDMNHHYNRVLASSKVMTSPYGDIEYSEGGSGPAVLVIHGSGGGHDQGQLIAQAVLSEAFHWIAPSRFGYLRSTVDDRATWDEQAHAYAHLLTQLGIDEVAVVALSHGGPSALLFALLHPDKVSSLTLISAGVRSSSTADQTQANEKGDMLTAAFQFDLPYWLLSKFFKSQFMELMGANEETVSALTITQRSMVEQIVNDMNPASLRSAGVVFDNKAVLPGERIAAIVAPTLIIHAKDDTLQLFHNAEFAASVIANSSLVSFERGGHLVVFVERAYILAETQRHITQHMGNLVQ